MKWIKWVCGDCGRMNLSRTPGLPAATLVTARCQVCRAVTSSTWSETGAPDMTVKAEGERWACPFCGCHNEVAAREGVISSRERPLVR